SRHQIGLQSGKYLRDAATGRISPNDDISKLKLRGKTFDVFDVVLDEIGALRIPIGIAVTAHVDCHHVIVLVEVRGNVVEGVRHAAYAVQHDQGRLIGRTPIQVVDPKTVDGHETVDGLSLGDACSLRLGSGPFRGDENLPQRLRINVKFSLTRWEVVRLQDDRNDVAIDMAGQAIRTVRRHQRSDPPEQLADRGVTVQKREALFDQARRRAVAAKVLGVT